MKLHGTIEIRVAGERVLRRPGFWDAVRRAFGGNPDLATGNLKANLEASALVAASRDAFESIGANNAVSLVIDDQVLFQDRERRPDDLGDLYLAFHDHADVFGKEFRMLRLAVEHGEAGLHYVLEVVARTEHPEQEAPARVVVAARLNDFEPRPGEDATAYRLRVEPLTQNTALLEVFRRQFEAFVERVAEALRRELPEAQIRVAGSDARVQRPAPRTGKPRRQPAPRPTDPRYDPYDHHYPNPHDLLLTFMVWNALSHAAFLPHLTVLDSGGAPLGSLDELGPSGAGLDSLGEGSGIGDGLFDGGDGGGLDDVGGLGDGLDGGDFDLGGFFD